MVHLYTPLCFLLTLLMINLVLFSVKVMIMFLSGVVLRGVSSSSLRVQTTSGAGIPWKGRSNLTLSPATTTTSCRFFASINGGSDLGIASFGLEAWLGSLLPALLIATILNWYSLPFSSFWRVTLVRLVSIVSHNCQSSSSPLILDSTW